MSTGLVHLSVHVKDFIKSSEIIFDSKYINDRPHLKSLLRDLNILRCMLDIVVSDTLSETTIEAIKNQLINKEVVQLCCDLRKHYTISDLAVFLMQLIKNYDTMMGELKESIVWHAYWHGSEPSKIVYL